MQMAMEEGAGAGAVGGGGGAGSGRRTSSRGSARLNLGGATTDSKGERGWEGERHTFVCASPVLHTMLPYRDALASLLFHATKGPAGPE